MDVLEVSLLIARLFQIVTSGAQNSVALNGVSTHVLANSVALVEGLQHSAHV